MTSFATDGVRYAAWQHTPVSPIVILETDTGTRRMVRAPGCVLDAEEPQRDENEPIDGDGWFLLSCLEQPRNGCFIAIYKHLLNCGEKLGEETAEETESRQTVSRVLNVRTGTVESSLAEAKLELPGASLEHVCSALRDKVFEARKEADEGEVAWSDTALVHPTRNRRNVRLERCHDHPLILPGPSEPTRYIKLRGPEGHLTTERLEPSEPNYFDLRDGVLSWSTGHDARSDDPYREAIEYGTLTAYRLSSGRLQTWRLPRLVAYGAPEEGIPGVFGYSAHTLNTVFWLAAKELTGGEAGACCVETSYLYAAPLR